MELKKLEYGSGTADDYLKELFTHKDSLFNLQCGTAFLEKGSKTPFKGDFTRHDQIKIVCILEGQVKLKLEEDSTLEVLLAPGDLFKVEKFEGHTCEILENTKLIYVMYG